MRDRPIVGALIWIKNLLQRFQRDDMPASSAQLTYYLVLALFPLLVFLLNILSYTELSGMVLTDGLSRFMPPDTLAIIRSVLTETIQAKSTTLLSFSALIAVWSTSRAMNAINRGLNKAFRKSPRRAFYVNLLLSVVFTLGMIVLVVLTLVLLVFGKLIGETLFGLFGVPHLFLLLWTALRYLIPFTVMVFLFSSFYRFMPNRALRFSQVWRGALFASGGWILASLLFSFYVNNFGDYSRVYGSLGGIIVFLIWLYLTSMILLLGGEINAFLLQGRDEE